MTKKKILSVALISVLTVFVFCLCFYFSGNALNQLPSITQMNYNLKSDEKPLTVKDMNNLSDRISFNQVSFCVELDETNVKEETVTPVLTNEFYFEIYGQKLNGNSIAEENIKNENKVAVISSSLALKLFFNTDAVGKTITLNDEVYTICGVIQESKNIINSLSSDGKQRIYIPYTCYSGYENCDVYTISYDNSASSAPLIEQMKLSQYHSTNFSEKANVIRNFENIIFLILFIGHKCRFSGLVITKISQMDHIGQYIISALYILCIIFECRCIDFHRCTGQHFYDRCFQSIIIHINKRHDRFIGRCFRPVTLKFTFKHHADYCSRIINLTVLQKISIIPSLHFMKISFCMVFLFTR